MSTVSRSGGHKEGASGATIQQGSKGVVRNIGVGNNY